MKPTPKCRHTTSSDGIEIKPCIACQPTPEEKCSQLIYEPWVMGMNKERMTLGCFTTLEKAEEILNDCIRENFTTSNLCDSGVSRKMLYLDSPSPEARCDVHTEQTQGCQRCFPPSPEARVDWEKDAQNMILMWFNYLQIGNGQNYHYFGKLKEELSDALQAAFEKGREAR
jgi:hypothetical protein